MDHIIENSALKDHYPLPSNGRVLILNMNEDQHGKMTREGSHLDVAKIKETFRAHSSFEIITHENFTVNDIRGRDGMLSHFIRSLARDRVDAVFVFIMAHGEDNSVLCAFDGKINFKKDILHRFCRESAPQLADIPKWFVVNACRGEEDPGRPWWGECYDSVPGKVVYSYNHTVVLYSTLEGFMSQRSPSMGSPLIQILCEYIDKYSRTHHLMDIFTKVSNELEKEDQQLTEISLMGSNKHFCLTQLAHEAQRRLSDQSLPSSSSSVNPPPANSSNGVNITAISPPKIKIEGLKPRHNIVKAFNNLSLFARLLYKYQVETGEDKSTCFKFLFRDDSEHGYPEIEGVAFNARGLILFEKLQPGCCVEIKEAKVEFKDWDFRNHGLADNELLLKFVNSHAVDVVDELSFLPKFPLMGITHLKEAEHIRHREIIDLLGTITHSFGVKETVSGNTYRESILKDVSDGTSIPLTLWGNRSRLEEGKFIFIRNVRVIRPSQIKDLDDDMAEDYEIKTDHYSVPPKSVIIEIQNIFQLDPEYRLIAKPHLENNGDGESRNKVPKFE